mgnify:FL=1
MRKFVSIVPAFAVVALALALAVMIGTPNAAAQIQTFYNDQDRPQDTITVGEPTDPGIDDLCDDEDDDENIDVILDCEVTRIFINLDGAVPTVTFFGTFCDFPNVYVGLEDGAFAQLLTLNATSGFVVADLTGFTDPATYVFEVECPCETCTCKATVGVQGPTGPMCPT